MVALLESSQDGIMAFRSIRGDDGSIIDFQWLAVNPSASEIVGKDRKELMASTLLEVFPGNRTEGLFDAYCGVVESGQTFAREQRYEHDGLDHWLRITAVPLGDGFAVTFRDISAEKAVELQLLQQATHDSLTGLLNRQGLERVLEMRPGDACDAALFFIDLDRFKVVNDSLGHASGDQLLREVGHRLSSSVRCDDLVARFGGDEFVVVAWELAADDRVDYGERLIRAVREPMLIEGRTVVPTASAGTCAMPAASSALPDAMRDADAAMYAAKGGGGNRCVDLDAATRTQSRRRLDRELELAEAIHGGQMTVEIQPMVDPRTRHVHGGEALVRWADPRHGIVMPDEFVPVAEDCGLVVPLGRSVIRNVASIATSWRRESHAQAVLGLNASPSELVSPDYAEHLLGALDEHGVPASMIAVEITESAMSQGSRGVQWTLEALSTAGITIAVDDFGTGFSAFERLRDFPVDALKIDRSFVRTLERSERDRRLVAGMIALARLDLFTVAEGVETSRQEEILIDMGADFAQGFLYAPPIRPDHFWMDGSMAPTAGAPAG